MTEPVGGRSEVIDGRVSPRIADEDALQVQIALLGRFRRGCGVAREDGRRERGDIVTLTRCQVSCASQAKPWRRRRVRTA